MSASDARGAPDRQNKVYLGDGAYASFDGFAVWITTENGIIETNAVCLEPNVLQSFLTYVEALHRQKREDAHRGQ